MQMGEHRQRLHTGSGTVGSLVDFLCFTFSFPTAKKKKRNSSKEDQSHQNKFFSNCLSDCECHEWLLCCVPKWCGFQLLQESEALKFAQIGGRGMAQSPFPQPFFSASYGFFGLLWTVPMPDVPVAIVQGGGFQGAEEFFNKISTCTCL